MSWILKFADDTKIYHKVVNGTDNIQLQQDLDRLVDVIHMGKSSSQHAYSINNHIIDSVERDLGVIISKDMRVLTQCNQACSKAKRMLGLIKRTIKCKT